MKCTACRRFIDEDVEDIIPCDYGCGDSFCEDCIDDHELDECTEQEFEEEETEDES